MASEGEIFSLSGPLFLTSIDWRNTDHRRCVAVSLVQSVYVLELDRQQNRQGPKALAPPWWEFFHFRLIQRLRDCEDHSYFGAIFEYTFPNSHLNYSYYSTHTQNQNQNKNQNQYHQNPPKYVFAFRGTVAKKDSRSQDFKLDLRVIRNNLHNSSRFSIASQVVESTVNNNAASDIWLAGHSLGSAIALTIGRDMVIERGIHLETYLFNQPFVSLPIEKIKNEKLKHGVRFTHSVVKAGLAVVVKIQKPERPHKNDHFTILSAWVPYLFVNPSDPICSEYVGYFEHREKMIAIGAGKIERIATQNSIRSIISTAIGKESVPSHLLPSAFVSVNSSPSPDFNRAHGIDQWWKPDLQCNCKLYQCNL
ncbi:GDSL esterase/lipase At4g10955-like [Nicotiana tabacum]|uniref:GDSL esterase/lipase At4g10955-like n=2 Tax=Nicotiana TaxID=4085 RepID=A0A1S4A6F3_TOBAC|nr:PREDICTED: GDSL esterase/lipase At4g10955-like [Nicotiana sylvestris]XP_009803950.1 PREDICTED: GDSL esterase/lipase At4g10955-like [Nicotiana sylvestris]XP_009803951.1 PREDICTED: GDSL esterase/lipase At4g10955-like [Nicotiana sylvestris]XP_016472200.1 PREDICTED: GDSL esterase/lipase At4g10955-like [Nicotiana tabacum]